MTSKLKKGEVRNLIKVPAHYGEKVTIGGERVTFRPNVPVTVYKDKYGRYTVVEKGHRLTAQEKALGLRRTRSGEAQFIKQQYETTGPMTRMRRLTANRQNLESRTFKPWQIGPTKGWIDIKRGSFIGIQRIGRMGDMERLMRSLDATTGAINEGYRFREMWTKMNKEQKFEVMQELQEMDWDNFWSEFIDSDGSYDRMPDTDKQVEGLKYVNEVMTRATGRVR